MAGAAQPRYDAERRPDMVELTEQQILALQRPDGSPLEIVNPRTQETFVLIRAEEYARLKRDDYDDSPWTKEERHALAWRAGKHAGWDEMDEYDDVPEAS
jgi:alpha-D-ribose 1-methylphosphonate 5-phosphate C-P lyase